MMNSKNIHDKFSKITQMRRKHKNIKQKKQQNNKKLCQMFPNSPLLFYPIRM